MQELADVFKTNRGMKEIVLSKSYRSTAPINKFAFDIIGIDNPDLYVDRDGKVPEIRTGKDMKADVMELLSSIPKEQSVAILTTDLDTSRWLKNKLGDKVTGSDRNIQYLLHQNQLLEEKIVVMPIMLAKGLEFDVVIVWDDRDEAYWEENKNLKYLMCTRALHELYFISEEPKK